MVIWIVDQGNPPHPQKWNVNFRWVNPADNNGESLDKEKVPPSPPRNIILCRKWRRMVKPPPNCAFMEVDQAFLCLDFSLPPGSPLHGSGTRVPKVCEQDWSSWYPPPGTLDRSTASDAICHSAHCTGSDTARRAVFLWKKWWSLSAECNNFELFPVEFYKTRYFEWFNMTVLDLFTS